MVNEHGYILNFIIQSQEHMRIRMVETCHSVGLVNVLHLHVEYHTFQNNDSEKEQIFVHLSYITDNLALHKPARVSEENVNYYYAVPSAANDGNMDTYFHHQSCSWIGRAGVDRPWWQVDTLRPRWITSVHIAHGGCSGNYKPHIAYSLRAG